MGGGEVHVSVGTMTRHYLACDLCTLQPLFFGHGYVDLDKAEEAARKHREAHAAQPYCTCATAPGLLMWDEDDEEFEERVGHGHCRHRGGCCECGCLTKATPPTAEPRPEPSHDSEAT